MKDFIRKLNQIFSLILWVMSPQNSFCDNQDKMLDLYYKTTFHRFHKIFLDSLTFQFLLLRSFFLLEKYFVKSGNIL